MQQPAKAYQGFVVNIGEGAEVFAGAALYAASAKLDRKLLNGRRPLLPLAVLFRVGA